MVGIWSEKNVMQNTNIDSCALMGAYKSSKDDANLSTLDAN